MAANREKINEMLDEAIRCLEDVKALIRNRDVAIIGPLLPPKEKLHQLMVLAGDLEITSNKCNERMRLLLSRMHRWSLKELGMRNC